jgi:hypothetical protein
MPGIHGTQYGSFVPTNFIWDIQQVLQLEEITPEFKELLVRLYQNLSVMADVVNSKDTGIYNTLEFVNSQQFFPNPAYNSSTDIVASLRPDYRMVVNFGPLPNSGTKSVAHNIAVNGATIFTRIYATATNPDTLAIPIPNVSSSNPVAIDVDPTYVNITTTTNMTAYTQVIVVIEYLKT